MGVYLGYPNDFTKMASKLLLGQVRIWAVEKAPVANLKCPLLLFSHGLFGTRTCYSTICTHLASHGYIVAAIEHRYISIIQLG